MCALPVHWRIEVNAMSVLTVLVFVLNFQCVCSKFLTQDCRSLETPWHLCVIVSYRTTTRVGVCCCACPRLWAGLCWRAVRWPDSQGELQASLSRALDFFTIHQSVVWLLTGAGVHLFAHHSNSHLSISSVLINPTVSWLYPSIYSSSHPRHKLFI